MDKNTTNNNEWRVLVRMVPSNNLNNSPVKKKKTKRNTNNNNNDKADDEVKQQLSFTNYDNAGVVKYIETLDEQYKFSYDTVFGPGTNQIDLYSYLDEHINKTFHQSENVSIYILGAKGSGRKHTLLGKTHGDELQVGLGIIPRTITSYFGKIRMKKKSPLVKYKISISICGIIKDKINDLIHTSNKNLRTEESDGNDDILIPDLCEKYVDDVDQAIKVIKRVIHHRKKHKKKHGKKNKNNNTTNEQHMIVKVKLEKWTRIDPTSPGIMANSKSKTPKLNALGGTTPAKSLSSNKNWKCSTSYIRFINFADLSSSAATNNDPGAENVQLTLSSFLRCTKDLQEKNDSLLACRDTKLTYVLKSSFTEKHTNIFIGQVSQRSKHSSEQVLPTLKFSSRVLQSTPNGMERISLIGNGEKNDRNLLWSPVVNSKNDTTNVDTAADLMDISIDSPTTTNDNSNKNNNSINNNNDNLVVRNLGNDDSIEFPGNISTNTKNDVKPVTLMKPILQLDGLEGKIKLNTPMQLSKIITGGGIMDNLEDSIGSLPSPTADEKNNGNDIDKNTTSIIIANTQVEGEKELITEDTTCVVVVPNGNKGNTILSSKYNIDEENDENRREEEKQQQVNNSNNTTMDVQDDEGLKLAEKLNAQIMGLKLGFTKSSTTIRANGQTNSKKNVKKQSSPSREKEISQQMRETAASIPPSSSTPQKYNSKSFNVVRIPQRQPIMSHYHKNVLRQTNITTTMGNNIDGEDEINLNVLNIDELKYKYRQTKTEMSRQNIVLQNTITEYTTRIEMVMEKYRELDDTSRRLWAENATLRSQVQHLNNHTLQMERLRATLEHESRVKDEQIIQLSAQLNNQNNTSGDVTMLNQSVVDNFMKEKETYESKIAKMELNIEQLSNDLQKKISEADEFKINNKVITVEMENMKEKLQHVGNEKNISDEKNEKLQFALKNEKELLANERKAAQASIAAYKDMEESLNTEHQRDLSLISMKDGELEKLRIALAKARDGLRLASERSLSLETKMKSNEIGSSQMRQMMSDSMNHLQASHAAEISRLQSKTNELSNNLIQARKKMQIISDELSSTQEHNRNLVDSVEDLQKKMATTNAKFTQEKSTLIEDISTLKVNHSNEITELHTERESLMRRLANAHQMQEELNAKVVNIDAALKREKNAREQSDFASKTYHEQIQTKGHMFENNMKEKDDRILQLEKKIIEQDSEMQNMESDKRHLFDQMELLKSKMDGAMSTNKKLLDNATNTINEHMEMNMRLIEQKEALSIEMENFKRELRNSRNEVTHLKKRLSSIQEDEDLVRNKIAGAMETMNNLNVSTISVGASGNSSKTNKRKKRLKQQSKANVSLNNISNLALDENDEDDEELEEMKKKLKLERQSLEIARLKEEIESLNKNLINEKKKSQNLFDDLNSMELKLETSEHHKRKLRVSFERSQKALKLALEECTKLLKHNKTNR